MKRVGFFIFYSLMSIFCVFSQTKADVSIEKTVHDFGQVNEEVGSVSCDFIIKNTGDAPLVISRVTASCGCTTPNWTKSPIAPGTTGTVTATYGAKGRPGPFSKTISVFTNAKEAPYILTIKGEVLSQNQSPEALYPISMNGGLKMKKASVYFNMVKNTENPSDAIEIYNDGINPITPEFLNVPKYMAVSCTPKIINPKSAGMINVTYYGPKVQAYGTYNDKIDIVLNPNIKNTNYFFVNATVTQDFSKMTDEDMAKAPVISIEPASISFNDLSKSRSSEIKITNNGKSNLTIHNIQITSPEIISVSSEKKEIKPGKFQVYKVTVNQPKLKKSAIANITISSNDPKSPIKRVRAIINLPGAN